MTKELFLKFLNNQCSESELDTIISWAKEDSFLVNCKDWAYSEWLNFKEEDNKNLPGDEEFDSMLNEIHHKINIAGNRERKIPFNSLGKCIIKAAAIMLVPVLSFLLYVLIDKPANIIGALNFSIDSIEVSTPSGSKTFVEFSDGTEVFLNHNSKLKYPQKFSGKTREVVLIGEGYFNVTHNAERPFIVKANGINVKVLGTSFNVSAYPDEDCVSTTLVCGSVLLEKSLKASSGKSIGKMVPGQHVNYNLLTGNILSTKGDIEKYVSWKDNKLVFKRDNMMEIARKLSHWYSVDIEFEDEHVKQYTYTATFVDEPLWHVLDMLKKAAPIDYRVLPRQKGADGSFTKQKIIIKKRDIN